MVRFPTEFGFAYRILVSFRVHIRQGENINVPDGYNGMDTFKEKYKIPCHSSFTCLKLETR